MDKPVLVETEQSTGIGLAVEGDGRRLEAESPVIIKPNGAENWVGPASRRRDNIGAPARQAFVHTHYHTKEQSEIDSQYRKQIIDYSSTFI